MICSKDKCTGCFGCYSICPKNAINMIEDENGNIYPVIDKKKCINCGLCKKKCPQLSPTTFNYPLECFASYSSNSDLRNRSTSGGIATVISKYILENGGVVFGAGNILNNERFNFIMIDSVDDLYKIQGSKYIHVYINDVFIEIKKQLKNKKVLFIGTPCQAAALKSVVGINENLVIIDIICHGVPNQKLFIDDINSHNLEIKDVFFTSFRNQNGYYLDCYDSYENMKKNNPIFSSFANMDLYYRNFLKGNIFRKNCYSCSYARKERVSDITLGDFWRLSSSCNIYDDLNKGISAVIINTEKGKNCFNSIKQYIKYEKREYEEIFKYNNQLNNPVSFPEKYDLFFLNYIKYGREKVYSSITTFSDRLKYNKFYELYKSKNNK